MQSDPKIVRARREQSDERQRERVQRVLCACPDIVVSNAEYCELLESGDPGALLQRIARDRRDAMRGTDG
jgi:hypothetical protein